MVQYYQPQNYFQVENMSHRDLLIAEMQAHLKDAIQLNDVIFMGVVVRKAAKGVLSCCSCLEERSESENPPYVCMLSVTMELTGSAQYEAKRCMCWVETFAGDHQMELERTFLEQTVPGLPRGVYYRQVIPGLPAESQIAVLRVYLEIMKDAYKRWEHMG